MIRKKRNIILKIFLNPKFLAVIVLFIVIALFVPVSRSISRRYRVDQEIMELEREIKEMEATNADFKKMMAYLESADFVEEQARLNLGLKKEGEEVVVIESADEAERLAQKKEPSDGFEKKENFFPYAWWNYFFGKKN